MLLPGNNRTLTHNHVLLDGISVSRLQGLWLMTGGDYKDGGSGAAAFSDTNMVYCLK